MAPGTRRDLAVARSNFARPRTSASRVSAAAERSIAPVGLTTNWGRLSASAVWKRTSSCVPIATAVSTMTTPSARWSTGPRPTPLTRANTLPAPERQREQHHPEPMP